MAGLGFLKAVHIGDTQRMLYISITIYYRAKGENGGQIGVVQDHP